MTSTLKVDSIVGSTTANTVAMPSGSVIQYKYQTSSTSVSNANNAYVATSVSISFTPKFSSSIIQIYWDGFLSKLASASGGFGYGIFKDGVLLHDIGSDSGPQPYEMYKDETRINQRFSRIISHSAANTNARTYTCRFRGYSSMTVIANNGSGGGNPEEIMTVMEIAQ
tara:strand:+ start:1039 stop:1542 length:504 start_codon:yes stop_codon:yes gene_type:complete